jgi:hypothetical protein
MEVIKIEELKNLLDKTTKKDLEAYAYNPLKIFLANYGQPFNEKLKKFGFNIKRVPSKPEMIEQLAEFYGDEFIAKKYIAYMHPKQREFLDYVLWADNISLEKIIEQFPGIKATRSSRYGIDVTITDPKGILKEWKQFFFHQNPYSHYHQEIKPEYVYFQMPAFLRLLLSLYYPKPKGYFIQPIEEGQLDDKYLIVNYEKAIFEELPLILVYNLQRKIKYSVKVYPIQASIKKMAKSLNLAEVEFYQEFCIRSGMLAGLIDGYFNQDILKYSSLDIIKWLFGEKIINSVKLPYLFPYITGFNKLNEYDLSVHYFIDFVELINKHAGKQWIEVDNLLKYIQYRFFDYNPFLNYNISQKLGVDESYFDSPEITKVAFTSREFGSDGLIRACIYLYASWGLLELAFDPKLPAVYSVYDNIVAYRLTNLGAFILNKTNTYEQPRGSENRLIFAEDGPFIKVEGSNDWASAILDNVADKVSNSRYKFSPVKFLSDVNDYVQLQNKIKVFKEVAAEQLPTYWESYFNKLVNNTKALKPVSNLHVFQLPVNEKEVIKLMASDNSLRKIIIKAEGFKILIEERNLRKFKNRMRELGYLIG